MERENVVKMLAILSEAYPKLADKPLARIEASINMWNMMLEEYPEEIAMHAMRLHMRESPFVPTPADIISRIEALRALGGDDALCLWSKLEAAIKDSLYHAQERYDALPYPCQRFVGSPSGLRSMGMIEIDILTTVTKGQFLKQAESLKKQQQLMESTPPALLEMAKGLTGYVSLPETDVSDSAINMPTEGTA